MKPKIVQFEEKIIVGISTEMSLVQNKTSELWKSFRGRTKEILNRSSEYFISLQQYPSSYVENFDPHKKFVKWACVEVDAVENMPLGMGRLVVEGGLYAVFNYKGNAENAPAFFQYIYGKWIPNSEYILDDRPQFEVLDAKYKNNDSTSEEEVWGPIKTK